MDFGLFHTWNVLYEGGKVPWDPEYRGGNLLEEDAYAKNWEEMQAVEAMGWDYIWLGGGHFSKQASMDPQVLLLAAVIAGHTNRIKSGSRSSSRSATGGSLTARAGARAARTHDGSNSLSSWRS